LPHAAAVLNFVLWAAYNPGMSSSAPDLLSSLKSALLPGRAQRICVAFSGGLDSSVLLHLLARMRPLAGFELSALHVHHGLSELADRWVEHCETVCAALSVSLTVERVDVARDAGKGLEAAAREVRHAAYARIDADWIALAHHADDQAETLLHRLVRGSGVAGAAGMRSKDILRRLWRPLLEFSRADLLAWARQEQLLWIEDDSNSDLRFFRNFLRQDVLASLNGRFPAASRNLARAAAHFAEASDLLDVLAAQDASQVSFAEPASRTRFRSLAGARQRNVLRFWLRQAGELAPDSFHTHGVCQALAGDAAVRELLGHYACCAWRERIWLEPIVLSVPERRCWQGEPEIPWGGGTICFESETGLSSVPTFACEGLEFRPRAGGERMRLAPERPMRSLRQLCQEAGIPAWWRDVLPMLWCGGELLWIGGVGAASPLPGLRIRWVGPDGVTRN
jgi:tRNA(Ile)-lysidine synthase